MARLLTQTLSLARSSPFSLVPLRRISKVEVIEIDLSEEDSASDPSSSGGGGGGGGGGGDPVEVMGMRRLEDAIHGVLVRRAAPDWLPFMPGGSYWVPPMRRPFGMVELVGRIAAAAAGGGEGGPGEAAVAMTQEETLSFTTVRGWPSAAYFVEGKSPHPVKRTRKDATQTDDEES